MYFTNTIKITASNNEQANKALVILNTKLAKGSSLDKVYRRNPSVEIMNNLNVTNNIIEVPKDSGFMVPEDAYEFFTELFTDLAENMGEHSFECEIFNVCDCSESEYIAKYSDGVMKITDTYYPMGYYEYVRCPECGEHIIKLEEFEAGKKYFCPECNEMIDLDSSYDDVAPVITEKEIIIK